MTNFLRKNLILLILTLVAFAATKWEPAYAIAGTILYSPVAVGAASLLYRLVIQIRFAETIEADSHRKGNRPSREKEDWDLIGSTERSRNRALTRGLFFLGIAVVVAAVVGR